MKRVYIYILLFLSIVTILFFGRNIFLIKYFNKSFYYTPKLTGYNIENATEMIRGSGVSIRVVDEEFSKEPMGTIVLQAPLEKQIIKEKRKINVWISKGPSQEKFIDVTGLQYNDAKSIIEKTGYKIGKVLNIASELPIGEVIATEPQSGSKILKNEKINILISNNVQKIKVPDLVGLTLDEGKVNLKNSSLLIGNIKYVNFEGMEPNIIVETSLVPNKEITKGTLINLIVSK